MSLPSTAWHLATPAALLLLLAAPVVALVEVRLGRHRRRAVLRAVIVALLAVAAARPTRRAGDGQPVLLLVDRSPSVDASAMDQLVAAAPDVPRIDFGSAEGTDLEDALDAGRETLSGGGHVLLATDGYATAGDAVAAAGRARAAGVAVDVLAVPPRPGPDVAVTSVEAPERVGPGDQMPVAVTLRARTPVSATVRVFLGAQEKARVPVTARPEGTVVRTALAVPADASGVLGLRASVALAGDVDPANDAAYAESRVQEPNTALVIADGLGGVVLGDALSLAGLDVTVAAPERVPTSPEALRPWDFVALADVPAGRLGPDRATALADYVRRGGGMLLAAGRQSFTNGGWEGSPLADLSPVAMAPTAHGERAPVALLLIIDQSASMGAAAVHPSVTKLGLAREAAALAAESLDAGDTVAVVAYSDEASWLVPPRLVGAGRELADALDLLGGLAATGGTHIEPALALGLPALADVPVDTRHAVLLTDGKDETADPIALGELVRRARARGVTVSTIALGADADAQLLARLAEIGHGRFHAAADADALPRLTLEESRIVVGGAEQTGTFRPVPGPDPALAAGLALGELPALTGYLALERRPAADVALETPNGDALLASWRVGLGQVAAWTSDTGDAWATAWAGNEAAVGFWSALARRLARVPGDPGLDTSVTVAGGVATIGVTARDAAGLPIDLATATAAVSRTLPGPAQGWTVPLTQVAPGSYEGRMPADVGAYALRVSLKGEDVNLTDEGGWTWSGPAEARSFRGGLPLLAAVASAGGGVSSASPPAWLADASRPPRPLWPALLVLAGVLWPLDVASQLGIRLRRPGRARVAGQLAEVEGPP